MTLGMRLLSLNSRGKGWSQQSCREEAGVEIPEWVSSFQVPGLMRPRPTTGKNPVESAIIDEDRSRRRQGERRHHAQALHDGHTRAHIIPVIAPARTAFFSENASRDPIRQPCSAHPLQCDVAGNLADVHGAGGQERLHLVELLT
jgi:hypothetical protein